MTTEKLGEPMDGRQLPLESSLVVVCGVCQGSHLDTVQQRPYDADHRILYVSEEPKHAWIGPVRIVVSGREDEQEAIRQGFELEPR